MDYILKVQIYKNVEIKKAVVIILFWPIASLTKKLSLESFKISNYMYRELFYAISYLIKYPGIKCFINA